MMSKINIGWLKVDADYWAEVAPLGATHHWEPSGDWYQDCGDHTLTWNFTGRKWQAASVPLRITRDEAIPRPTKREEPLSWEGGLPPVGVECEFIFNRMWVSAKVVGYDGPACVVAIDGEGYEGSRNPSDFRPIKSQHERQREELISVIDRNRWFTSQVTADAILSRFTLEPRQ